MNKLAIMNKASNLMGKTGLKLKKYSPEILVVAGVVGTVASAVMACQATLKVNEVLEKSKKQIDSIHECAADASLVESGEYSPEDAKKDLAIVYAQTGLQFAKLYGPAVILGALSITSILASNNILRKRNIALGAAYATLDQSFKDYRKRVVDRFGEAVDRELKYNIKAQKVEEMETDPETGKQKKVKKTIEVSDGQFVSPYARFFDESSRYFEKNPELNLMFLRAEQNFANDRLKARGYVFLNEIYERLGIPTTKAGQVVGWIYDPKNGKGDNYIDFGIYDMNREKVRDFVNGYERVILLDFNVDGDILNEIETHQAM